MAFDAIFTLRSLEIALQRSADVSWLNPDVFAPLIDWGLARVRSATGVVVFLSSEDSVDESRIVIHAIGSGESLDRLPTDAWRQALQRIHRAALAAKTLPFRLPRDWSVYHHDNLVALFACSKELGAFRWIAELDGSDRDDIHFWKITGEKDALPLGDFKPAEAARRQSVESWTDAFKKAQSEVFSRFAKAPTYVPLDGVIDLKHATYGAVTGSHTYSGWVRTLTDEQRRFFEHPSNTPVKLRGPAGSGKTLALELRALRELYDGAGADGGAQKRLLFVTHSWAMAEQVDGALHRLDERGLAERIDVYPLVEIAKTMLIERYPQGLNLLGDDSYSGRRLLLDRIGSTQRQLRQGDWLVYRDVCSPEFRLRVESEEHSAEWNSLVWDLSHEFASVLGASSILPGMTAERRYLALRRADWMMPLASDAEKRFVLRVYSEYVRSFREQGLLSVDQLMNDFLNYLETFAWDYLRVAKGYDAIFVDEFHLFSDQERQTLNYLGRDAQGFPRVSMALDPRQSPSDVYLDFPVTDVATAQSAGPETSMGRVEAIDLTSVHRFSSQVLELVKFIHQSFPAMQLGADWLMDTSVVHSTAPSNDVPSLYQYASPEEEVKGVARRAVSRQAQRGGAHRLAVVLVDDRRLPEFEAALPAEGLPVIAIKSRDDIDALRYSKRSVVLSSAEHVAGLQFDDVIVAGVPTNLFPTRLSDPQMRRILSALYVAVTRASEQVELHFLVTSDEGDLAAVLQRAVKAGVLEVY